MRVAVCDDERDSALALKHKIENIFEAKSAPLDCAIYTSPELMLKSDLSAVQAVFLDIDMPEMNGLEAARQLRLRYPNVILVFVTSFIEYAPEGYSVEAFRYLLKRQMDAKLPSIIEDVQKKLLESSDSICIEQRSGSLRLPLRNIMYLEGTPNRMVLLHLSDSADQICAVGKLSDYERRLEGRGFLRVQKSFIANMLYIGRISNYQVTMKNGVVLNASEKYYKQLTNSFLHWKGQNI